jgi:hypothetical protein
MPIALMLRLFVLATHGLCQFIPLSMFRDICKAEKSVLSCGHFPLLVAHGER